MHQNHVWSYDFVMDRTADGRAIRMLTVVEEFTRECLAIDVARKLTSEDVLERLSDLFVSQGVLAPPLSARFGYASASGQGRSLCKEPYDRDWLHSWVKASGGIRSWEACVGYLAMGCARIGVGAAAGILDEGVAATGNAR